MSSDESDSPTSLVPPGLVRIKNEQSPSLIKANSGADGVSSSGSAAVLMPVGGKLNALPLGSAVKTAAVQLLRPVNSAAGPGQFQIELMNERRSEQQATSGQDSQDEDDQETAAISGGSPYSGTAKSGPVSPSPYTANTLRAKAFNAYVKGLIEQRLNLHIPISLQPRELLSDIIADVQHKFPDFSSCVRKRIRTFLKSYRRSKKVRESIAVANAAGFVNTSTNGGTSRSLLNGATVMSAGQDSSPKPMLDPVAQTAVVTIAVDNRSSPSPTPPIDSEVTPPESKRVRLDSPFLPTNCYSSQSRSETNSPQLNQGLCSSEVNAVRQLVLGYRESAAFLLRAADKLEQILPPGSL
ncbi:nucleolar protein 4-like isoform X2 [Dysidea avara]|uniref:nucleolar protein 4-like isoform X2 n=1 Tax=Dysidea avara TaxID=196820 RepID=UPI00332E3EFE